MSTLAIDCETTGLDFTHGCKPFCVITCDDTGVEQCWEWQVDPITRQPKALAQDLEQIAELVHQYDKVVGHNIKFDVQALGTLMPDLERDWPWDRTHDTANLAHLLQSNAPKGLDDLSIRYLRTDISKYEKALREAVEQARRVARKWFPKWHIAKEGDPSLPSSKGEVWRNDYWLPKELYRRGKGRPGWDKVLRTYAEPDPVVTLMVFQRMIELVEQKGLMKIYEERCRLLPVVAAMERRGITVNPAQVASLKEEYETTARRLGMECQQIALQHHGVELTLPKGGRNDQLRKLLLEDMGLEPVYDKKSKTGEPTTNKAARNHWLDTLEPTDYRHQFIKAFGSRQSRLTAVQFLDGYSRFWVPHNEEPGWRVLHPSFNMVGSDTLRFTCRNPNGQNISKKEDFNLRRVFCPPPGWEFWSFDARGIEDRLPAYKSGQQELIDIFEKADEPPYYGSNHILRFHTIYPDLWDEAVKEVGLTGVAKYVKKKYADTWYQWCKNGGFAIQYGAVDKLDGTGTADRAFHKPGAHALLKQRFSALEKLNRGYIDFANQHGYVETFPDKSIDPNRGYPLYCTRTDKGTILETVPLSYVIQGTAMWWTCRAMVRVEALLAQWRREGFDCYIALQVHDELLIAMRRKSDPRKAPQRSNLWRARAISREMSKGGDDYDIPTPTGVEWHPESYSVGISF